ncbi:TonB-linked outer membrane protein, SusC/RagA family [Hymenobacter daecheongensis DSM 21074]|uniref:TonB-linked outer membrane protein, SusC/RagA family n=1 Tax=Hymenobacter daecheongensis DSM 21074 TaxID=1121955 RepID=A0A1M6G7E8_9BACT|nr:TonB-dependent receptor [Hymenobacter daecheongensis]SHJ05849.1 TonB-linked outer membrane protein, SusC/RagA family [Hymenobacter daecheongensis DSM 21074]
MTPTNYSRGVLRHAWLLAACSLPALAAPALAGGSVPPLAVAGLRVVADVPVSGRVTQANGEGLPGVTIIVKGTTIGTSSNADGGFSLSVPEGSTLVFSYVGYVRKEVALTGATSSLTVMLQEDAKALSEVVVVGYGTQERTSVTGAVSSVSGKDIASQPVSDPTQALQGRAAGVTVTQNSGAPGGAGGTSVRVRGITSAGNNSPLYVIDGYPLPSSDANGNGVENQLNAINPSDIESIDVLKDASATAIYGLRAANGVVIITTKRGKAGTATVNLDAYMGIQRVWRKLSLLNAEEYAVINNESRIAKGDALLPQLRDPKALGEGTNWQDQVFRQASIQSYNLSATGGSDKARYAVSGGYFKQDGTIIGSTFERFTLRANGDVQLNKILKIGNSISLTHLTDRQVDTGGSEFGVLSNVLQIPATLPVYNFDGTWYEPGLGDGYVEPNPVLQALITNSKFTRNRALTTFFAELEPLKGLRFRTNVGADLIFDNGNAFTPSLGPNSPRNAPGTASATAFNNYNPSYLIENTLSYDRTIGEQHQLTLLVGQSAQQFTYSTIFAGRAGYSSNTLQQIDNGPINALLGNGGFVSAPDRLASYFGRANYEFGGKYLFAATARYDGSSAFAPGRKFGFFPGVSAGWRLSEESFIKDISLISNLKVRAGWGRVGNPLNAGRFAYLANINSGITYPFGPTSAQGTQNIVTGAAPTKLQNPDLQWEINEQTNVGIDVGILQNRVEATLDLYNRRSPNLISLVPPAKTSGTYEPVNTNAIDSYNRGLDLSVTTRNLTGANNGPTWTTSLVFSTYKSQIDKLGVAVPFNGLADRNGNAIVRYDQGQPFGSFYGYVADGLFQTAEDVAGHASQPGAAPGDIRFRDLNGDNVINDLDRDFIGDPNPSFNYGITNTVAWRGFDLSVFLQGSQGNDVYNLNRFYTEGGLTTNGNSSTRVLKRWTGPGTSNDVPRAIAGDPNLNLRISSYFVEDGSYMRIKLLTVGYTIPKTILSRVAAQSLRLYVSSQNLLTLTEYMGFDPEVGPGGVDRGVYPQSRVFLAGLNIGF